MAEKFGLDKELQLKQEAKYNPHLEEEARQFVCRISGASIPPGRNCIAQLKDGVALCQMVNALRPNSVKKINTNKMPFMQMENIGSYLSACEALGVRRNELFQTVDLFEEKNLSAVTLNILAVARLTGHTVSNPSAAPPQVDTTEQPKYQPPPSDRPAVKVQTGVPSKGTGYGGETLLSAGARIAGESAKGTSSSTMGGGRRDINSGAKTPSVGGGGGMPLLQAGALQAGNKAQGSYGPGIGTQIAKANAVNYGKGGHIEATGASDMPLLQAGALKAGEAAKQGAGGVGREINRNAQVNFGKGQ